MLNPCPVCEKRVYLVFNSLNCSSFTTCTILLYCSGNKLKGTHYSSWRRWKLSLFISISFFFFQSVCPVADDQDDGNSLSWLGNKEEQKEIWRRKEVIGSSLSQNKILSSFHHSFLVAFKSRLVKREKGILMMMMILQQYLLLFIRVLSSHTFRSSSISSFCPIHSLIPHFRVLPLRRNFFSICKNSESKIFVSFSRWCEWEWKKEEDTRRFWAHYVLSIGVTRWLLSDLEILRFPTFFHLHPHSLRKVYLKWRKETKREELKNKWSE